MKKLLYILVLMMLFFGISACKDDIADPIDIEVEVLSETFTFDQIVVHVLISYNFEDINDLNDVVQTIAGETYLDYFVQIDGKRFTMTVYVYNSQSDFDTLNATRGYHTFDVNRVNSPGLSPGINALKIT
jgi:hypothetical protein